MWVSMEVSGLELNTLVRHITVQQKPPKSKCLFQSREEESSSNTLRTQASPTCKSPELPGPADHAQRLTPGQTSVISPAQK